MFFYVFILKILSILFVLRKSRFIRNSGFAPGQTRIPNERSGAAV